MFEQYVINKFLKQLEKLIYGSILLTTPDGKHYHFIGIEDGLTATIHIHNWSFLNNIAAKGDIGLAESYRDGLFDTDNLAHLLTIASKNIEILDGYVYGGALSNLTAKIIYSLRSNSLQGSKKNIHSHYDLGNDFYSLWLDPSMTYSAALFQNDNEPLEQAQHNKYDRIIERLEANSGNLLEVGCGWGGFAERALHKNDFGIKAITISEKQHKFAKARLKNKASIELEDYRKQEGKYDNIVSIEMFEAVGEKYWPVYFEKIKYLLNEKGKAVVQTITIGDEYFERYRTTGDMIRTFIFPGGMLPSKSRFVLGAEMAGLKVTDSFAFGKDYATTLQHWLKSFEQNLQSIRAMNFDEKFIRIWRFYLAVCIAGFSSGRTDVIQAEIAHA